MRDLVALYMNPPVAAAFFAEATGLFSVIG